MTGNNTNELCAVVLCGGSGMRLWPLSRETYPKPFIKITHAHTLIADTLERVKRIGAARNVLICNETHRFYLQEALRAYGLFGDILLEPEPRNTAPAIALAAFDAVGQYADPILLILPADHAIEKPERFNEAVAHAMPMAKQGKIVLFGVVPDRPEIGYGYVECGEKIDNSCMGVNRFIEKPDNETARQLLEKGNHFWNSGIFLMLASTFLEELKKYAPDIYKASQDAWQKRQEDEYFTRPDKEEFLKNPAISVDYAIMEKTDKAVLSPLGSRWSDLGSWESFYDEGEKNEQGNVENGDIISQDSSGCYLHSQSRLVAAVGLRDIVVVESADAVLVTTREHSQNVRGVVEALKREKRKEYREHRLVFRPWGSYDVLATGERFQVKKIIVQPGSMLSLQLHHHRTEHWIIVKGTAEVTLGDKTCFYTENQSLYIPVGITHMLKNPGLIPLEMIEIQSGSYLGEDDIVRFNDIYGRVQK